MPSVLQNALAKQVSIRIRSTLNFINWIYRIQLWVWVSIGSWLMVRIAIYLDYNSLLITILAANLETQKLIITHRLSIGKTIRCFNSKKSVKSRPWLTKKRANSADSDFSQRMEASCYLVAQLKTSQWEWVSNILLKMITLSQVSE